MEIKATDYSILKELKKDARITIRNLAKRTSLRPSTVHKRLQKLKEEGIIEKFTVKLDNQKVGEELIVLMFIKTKPNQDIDKRAFNNSRVKEVFGITGEYDLLIKLKFRDVKEFNDYVIKFRRDQPIESTHTMVVTANLKEEI